MTFAVGMVDGMGTDAAGPLGGAAGSTLDSLGADTSVSMMGAEPDESLVRTSSAGRELSLLREDMLRENLESIIWFDLG